MTLITNHIFMMYNPKPRCPETGRISRVRNRFYDNTAEQRYNSRLPMAKLVRQIGNKNGHTIAFLMKYRKNQLDQICGLINTAA